MLCSYVVTVTQLFFALHLSILCRSVLIMLFFLLVYHVYNVTRRASEAELGFYVYLLVHWFYHYTLHIWKCAVVKAVV